MIGVNKLHSNVTVEYILDKCFRLYWEGKRSELTNASYLSEVSSYFGGVFNPRKFSQKSLEEFIFYLREKGNAPATINRKLSILSKVLSYCESHGLIEKKPKLEYQKEENSRIRWVTPEEERTIIDWFNTNGHPEMASFCTVAIYTGMRCSEILGLEPRDVDFKSGAINLQITKTGVPRTIPMNPLVNKLLLNQNTEDKFFSFNQDRVNYLWNKMKASIGLGDDTEFTPHCLRHTFCSRLAQNGVNVALIQRLAGHKTVQMTMRYTHLDVKSLEGAIGTLLQT